MHGVDVGGVQFERFPMTEGYSDQRRNYRLKSCVAGVEVSPHISGDPPRRGVVSELVVLAALFRRPRPV